jgi:NAD(P)-dependent dehydrogenase (short-subunit alcohol dehydrogenase family)
MSEKRIAIVTGSNRGIGYSIVKRLCKEFDGTVYLTG